MTTQDVYAALADAETAFDWALRHGNPGDVSRARRFLAEAKAQVKDSGTNKNEVSDD